MPGQFSYGFSGNKLILCSLARDRLPLSVAAAQTSMGRVFFDCVPVRIALAISKTLATILRRWLWRISTFKIKRPQCGFDG